MDSSSLPAIYPPAAARDTSSPISDCIVVRDCDSSSVFTVDTAITSIVPTSDGSKENSRAGSVPLPMDTTEEVISSEEIHLVVKLETLTVPRSSHYAQSGDINGPDLEAATSLWTRVLRQRPPRLPSVVKPPALGRKARPPTRDSHTRQPSPQLSDVIQIRGPSARTKDQNEGYHRRRSLRLSLIANNLSKHLNATLTPRRNCGKRTHEAMNAGSKSTDAKLCSQSWGNDLQSLNIFKGKDYSSEEGGDSSEEDVREEEEEVEEHLPKRKKIWAIQGLFVGQEENFDPRRRTKRGRLSGAGALPQKSKTLLPLPMSQGQAIMDNRRDFKLPFNIFSPTPYRVHPPGWKVLSRNVLVGDARDQWKSETELTGKCTCVPQTGCDENCLNRCVYYECNDENCNVGLGHCQNRQFAALKARVAKKTKFAEGVEVMQTKDRGFGLRAIRSFEPNQIIVEYCGEIISQEETESRMRKIYKNNNCYYLMLFDQSMIIDATRGSVARFVNHSCEPNCRMEKWIVDNKPRMALFAGENGVETGEELTYDYNFNWFSGVSKQICRCGSSRCRGAMGKRTDGRKAPVGPQPKPPQSKQRKRINRIRSSITVVTPSPPKITSTQKSVGSRHCKVIKPAVVKKMLDKNREKRFTVKPATAVIRNLDNKSRAGRPILKPIGLGMQPRGNRTYAHTNRSIKVESPAPEPNKEEVSSVAILKGVANRPKRTTLAPSTEKGFQTLAKTIVEKTGFQGTVLDTIVVVG